MVPCLTGRASVGHFQLPLSLTPPPLHATSKASWTFCGTALCAKPPGKCSWLQPSHSCGGTVLGLAPFDFFDFSGGVRNEIDTWVRLCRNLRLGLLLFRLSFHGFVLGFSQFNIKQPHPESHLDGEWEANRKQTNKTKALGFPDNLRKLGLLAAGGAPGAQPTLLLLGCLCVPVIWTAPWPRTRGVPAPGVRPAPCTAGAS